MIESEWDSSSSSASFQMENMSKDTLNLLARFRNQVRYKTRKQKYIISIKVVTEVKAKIENSDSETETNSETGTETCSTETESSTSSQRLNTFRVIMYNIDSI